MQNVWIAILTYTKPLNEVDALLPAYRQYLQKLLDQRKLILSGRLQPRTGGIIIAHGVSREELEDILQNDPFIAVSKHTILEFIPAFYDDCLKNLAP